MLVIINFLVYFLHVKCAIDDRKIRRFEDIQSQEVIDKFESFPLQWEDVRPSEWCEVRGGNALRALIALRALYDRYNFVSGRGKSGTGPRSGGRTL